MPEPLDRATFLRQVADAVDLQPTEVGEVLEELNSHLSDAAAGWREAGLELDDAERRALRGLGDPETLGRELGQARHERRQLLAAVGGGFLHAITFGIWSFLFLWLVLGGVFLIGVLLTIAAAQAIGLSASDWFTGPSGSLGTVAITVTWFAWLGWVLPHRVARSSHRSVRGVKLAVGLIGCAIGSVLLWTMVQADMDQVLALGLPLGPFAFLLAALRPSPGPSPFPATTVRLRFGVVVALLLATLSVGLATAARSGSSGWGVDAAGLGQDISEVPLLAGLDLQGEISADFFRPQSVTGSLAIGSDADFATLVRKYPTASLEVWPTVPHGDMEVPGAAPLAVTSAPIVRDASGDWLVMPMPAPRTPMHALTVLVAVGVDGSRVLLAGPDPNTTPTWHGTLLDWWFGAR